METKDERERTQERKTEKKRKNNKKRKKKKNMSRCTGNPPRVYRRKCYRDLVSMDGQKEEFVDTRKRIFLE